MLIWKRCYNKPNKAPSTALDLEELELLSQQVLDEIVREGEAMIGAQFQSHLATDQRAFTFAGLALTLATAGFAGLIALQEKTSLPVSITSILAVFTLGITVSAALALASAFPRAFCLPGNEPKNWHPIHWQPGTKRTLHRVRFEQAKILQSQISKNRELARRKAMLQRLSFSSAYLLTLGCAIWLLVVV